LKVGILKIVAHISNNNVAEGNPGHKGYHAGKGNKAQDQFLKKENQPEKTKKAVIAYSFIEIKIGVVPNGKQQHEGNEQIFRGIIDGTK
jgi:hypothetical protein